MLRAVLGGAVAAVVLSAPALAAPLTRPALPSFCREWGGEDTIALACDPDKRATQIGLRLGAIAAEASHERGIAKLAGREPLLAGETLTLTWSHPPPPAGFAVTGAAPPGPAAAASHLPPRPRRLDVI